MEFVKSDWFRLVDLLPPESRPWVVLALAAMWLVAWVLTRTRLKVEVEAVRPARRGASAARRRGRER